MENEFLEVPRTSTNLDLKNSKKFIFHDIKFSKNEKVLILN